MLEPRLRDLLPPPLGRACWALLGQEGRMELRSALKMAKLGNPTLTCLCLKEIRGRQLNTTGIKTEGI